MSEVINTNKFLDFSGLKKYDALIKAFIASEDSKLSAAIDALVAKLGDLEFDGSDDKTVSEVVEGIYASIAEIVEKQGALEAKDAELEDMIAEEIAKIAGDEESLVEGASVMTLVEVANKLKALDDSVSKNTEDIAKVTERVSSLEKTIEDLGAIEGGENLATIVSKVNDNTVAIETLNGDENTIGSVKKAAKDAADAAGAAALADAKAYADGLATNYDAAGAADQALTDAKAYADGLAANYDAAGAADQALTDAKAYVDGKVDGKFDELGAAAAAETAAKAYADGLATNYDAAGAADQALTDAKAYVDGKVDGKFDELGAADQALTDAKAYVDGKVDGKFDELGAAAAAETAAKAYADGLAVNYDAAGTAAGLNAAMDERVAVLEAIDHEQLAADASAAAVAAIVAGAESDFDTLKDVADWIGSHKEGAAELQTTVSDHTESINTINGEIDALEAKVDEDIANLTTHMTDAAAALDEVDGRLDALEEFKNSHETITEEDINGLFA